MNEFFLKEDAEYCIICRKEYLFGSGRIFEELTRRGYSTGCFLKYAGF
jgi:hypothetical protein